MVWNVIGRRTEEGSVIRHRSRYAARIASSLILFGGAFVMSTPSARAVSSYVPPVVTTANVTLYSSSTSITPGRVAIDKAGNVFYVANGSSSTLMEIPVASPAAPVPLITGLGQFNARAIVVDGNGNLWVTVGSQESATPPAGGTDFISLAEIPALNGIPNTNLVGSGMTLNNADANHCTTTGTVVCTVQNFRLNDAGGMVAGPQVLDFWIDGSGDIDYVDISDNNLPAGSSRIVQSNVYSGNGTVLGTVPQDFSGQVAVDAAGNVFYCSPNAGNVSQVSGGSLTTVGNTAALSFAQIASPTGISTDQWGNLYIASGAQLSEVPFEGTALNFADEFGVINGLSGAGKNSINWGGGLDAKGNYYYAYDSGSSTTLQQLQINGYNFGSVTVGTLATGPTLTLFANAPQVMSSFFTTASPTSNSNAALLQSFPFSGTKSFAGGSTLAAGSTGTIVMDFQPIHPGLLKGSYTPRNGSTNEATINLQGVGVGPQPVFLPGIASALFSSAATSSTIVTPVPLNGPSGIAVDTFGDIFVADTDNGKVVADCLSTTTAAVAGNGSVSNSFCGSTGYLGSVVELSTGFTKPAAIALDGVNNLYVVDSAANSVTLVQSVNLTSSALVTSTTDFGSTPLSSPKGIAVDGYANLYIADSGNNRIVMAHQFGAVATDNSVYVPSTVTFGGTALSNPTGLALDPVGDLFIADTGNNRIVEYSSLGIASVVSTTGVTLNAPTDVKITPSGALIVTDAANEVSLIANSTGSALPIGTLVLNNPQGIALDLASNLYISDTAGGRVLELAVSSPAPVNFPSTGQGGTSFSTATTVLNTGNAALSFSGAPSIDAGDINFGVLGTGTCASGTTLAPGVTGCTVLSDFVPQASGVLMGSVTLTDNQLSYTLNMSTATETAIFGASGMQNIGLSGIGTGSLASAPTPTFSIAPATYNSIQLVSIADTTTGAAIYYTLDGSMPTAGSTLYTSPIVVATTETIKAIAIASGFSNSAAAAGTYTINLAGSRLPIVVSQLSWIGAINGGGFLAGGNPTGGSFAVNQQGNIIVSNTFGSAIYMYNGTTGAVATLSPAGGFSNPGGITVDSRNNLYISNNYNPYIYKIPYVGGAYATISSPSSPPPACTGADTTECLFVQLGSASARAIAFDSAGNFYMVSAPSTSGATAIYECSVTTCQPSGTGTLIYSDTNTIGSIAIDPWGNLFFTDAVFANVGNEDSTNSALNELTFTAGTGFSTTPIVLETYTDATPGNFDDTLGAVGTDANGTVYYATQFNGMYALPNNHGSINTANGYGISPQGAKGMTLDANGNVYIVAFNNNNDSVGKILVNNVVVPAAALGTSSTATNVTVMDNSAGCSSSPVITIAASENGSSTTEFSGATTGTCAGQSFGSDFAGTITFTPTATGPRSATLLVSDTTSGAIGVAQVSSTGNPPPAQSQTITFPPLTTPITYTATPIMLTATASSGLPVTFSVLSGPATISGNALTITGIGTVVIAADQAGNATFSAAPEITQSIVVNQASQTIAFTAPATPVAFTSTPITLSATASSGLAVTFSVTSGPGTISGNSLTITGVGTIVVAANQAGNATYAAATAVPYSIVVNSTGTAATPAFTPASGTYTSAQSVTISDKTPGAVIYYTTNGTAPTASSTIYSNPIPVTASATVQAIAVAAGYTNSQVGSATYTINLTQPSFTIGLNPASLTVASGTQGTVSLTVSPQNGFNAAVSFACSGLPAGATCTFTPATVTPTAGPSTTALTIVTPVSAAAIRNRSKSLLPEATLAVALCLIGFRRRRTVRLLVLAIGIAGVSMLAGCGSSKNNQPASTTVTVTATSGSLQQTISLALTVQ